MTQSVAIFGRLPALSLAELEALFGAENIHPIGRQAAIIDIEPKQIDFTRLGGTVKFAKLLTILDTTSWIGVQKFLEQSIPQHLDYLPDGKMKLGLSVYGLKVSVGQLNATGLSVKKLIKATGRSVRVVPNKELALNSAQVLHNQLTSALGWELILIKHGDKTVVAQNIAEQDIDAYAARDQNRPKRDARVGMLPPKLAQTIVNLATGKVESTTNSQQPTVSVSSSRGDGVQGKDEQAVTARVTILDPFCGTGVVLQEAALMGYDVYGTDIEQRMIDYSHENLDWLGENFSHPPFCYFLDQGDATNYKWQHSFDTIASEAYLGQPFSNLPSCDKLEEVRQTCDTIIQKFLKNLASQTQTGFRLCLAVPSWNTKTGFLHLKTLDKLADLGYTRVSFVHVKNSDLLYYREDQVVARELLVLERV